MTATLKATLQWERGGGLGEAVHVHTGRAELQTETESTPVGTTREIHVRQLTVKERQWTTTSR